MIKKLMSRKVLWVLLLVLAIAIFTTLNYHTASAMIEGPHLLKWLFLVILNAMSLLTGYMIVSEIDIVNIEISKLERKIKEMEREEQDSE